MFVKAYIKLGPLRASKRPGRNLRLRYLTCAVHQARSRDSMVDRLHIMRLRSAIAVFRVATCHPKVRLYIFSSID